MTQIPGTLMYLVREGNVRLHMKLTVIQAEEFHITRESLGEEHLE